MSRGARAVRGTAVAVFATFVASLAHTLGGGSPPAAVALMVALAFSVPFAMALSGGRAPVMRTAVSALVAQAALHLTYSLGGACCTSGASRRSGVGWVPAVPLLFGAPLVRRGADAPLRLFSTPLVGN